MIFMAVKYQMRWFLASGDNRIYKNHPKIFEIL